MEKKTKGGRGVPENKFSSMTQNYLKETNSHRKSHKMGEGNLMNDMNFAQYYI